MNLVYGEVVDARWEEGMLVGTVRVSGAMKRIALDLLSGIEPGDRVLLCDGVAIGKVRPPADLPCEKPIHDSRITIHD
jgi:hydrogenase maturation factor